MRDIDRHLAQNLMQTAGMDALVLFRPESFRYAVGASAGVATMWGRAGAAIVMVPANEADTLGVVASDHAASSIRGMDIEIDLRTHRIWIDMVDATGATSIHDINSAYRNAGAGGPRPETFDQELAFALLGDMLRERGLAKARIGADLDFLPAADLDALKRALPDVTWIDGSDVLRRMRAIKSAREISRLRRAALAAEAGLVRMAGTAQPGVRLSTLSAAWQQGALDFAAENGFSLSGRWDFISLGPDLSDISAEVSEGALIKADVGALVEGYSSDGARSFTYGPASTLARDIFSALEEAFTAGLEQLRPGNSFGMVHDIMMSSMRRSGFAEYNRGHFGHSVGGSVGMEEWPFFSAGNTELIQPNMVVALEAPFYAQGIGALMIEDQFLVTESGYERMTTLPWDLRDLARDPI